MQEGLKGVSYWWPDSLQSKGVHVTLLVPGLAVSIRRLHDVGKSGWYLLINLIPIAGPIWFLVLACTDSQPGHNKYGPNPKEQQVASPAQSADAQRCATQCTYAELSPS